MENTMSMAIGRNRLHEYSGAGFCSAEELEKLFIPTEEIARHVYQRMKRAEDKVRQYEDRDREVTRLVYKLRASLQGAMDMVAQFAYEHEEIIDTAFFGTTNDEFRFILLTKPQEFDWQAADRIAELEMALVEDYGQLPIVCQTLPSAYKDEVNAILEERLGSLKPRDEVATDANSR